MFLMEIIDLTLPKTTISFKQMYKFSISPSVIHWRGMRTREHPVVRIY